MTAKTRYFVISSLLVMFVGLGSGLVAYYGGFPASAFTSAGGPEELQYIPKDAAVVAYADVRHIMTSELRQRIRRAVPGQENGQQEFQNHTGINIETDIDHVVASLQPGVAGSNVPATGIVVVRGSFNEATIEALMREHGAQVEQYKGKRIVVAPAGHHRAGQSGTEAADPTASAPAETAQTPEFALAFLKPGLVAVGTPALLKQAIDLESGGASVLTNEEMMNAVRSLDVGNAWVVGRFDVLKSAAKLPTGIGELPPIALVSATATVNDGVSATLKAEASTEEAAKNLRDVVQGFVALASLQAGSKPELKALVQSLELSGAGKTVALSFSVPGRILDLVAPAAGAKAGSQRAH